MEESVRLDEEETVGVAGSDGDVGGPVVFGGAFKSLELREGDSWGNCAPLDAPYQPSGAGGAVAALAEPPEFVRKFMAELRKR